jgi:hypothetical protein
LGTRITAAYDKLREYKDAAAKTIAECGTDGGWAQSITQQEVKITRLEAERQEMETKS